jgi:hypothetical protein
VRCWWRLPPSSSGSCLLRQVSGRPDAAFWRRVALEADDAHLRELRLECLVSGRRRYLHLDTMGVPAEGLPNRDVGSLWGTADASDRRRHKFLVDLEAVCDRAARRGVVRAFDASFLVDLAGELARVER